jgi:transcriptional regulator with XRE-family HTH domain
METVAVRPVFHAELGAFFRNVRVGRKLGLRQAVALAAQKRIPGITKTVLHSLETGRTKNPEPEVLHALARLYTVPYADLVAAFVNHRYGMRDLPGQSVKLDLASHRQQPGGAHAQGADPARILELEARERYLMDVLRALQDVATIATDTLAAQPQPFLADDATTRGRQPKPRRSPGRAS